MVLTATNLPRQVPLKTSPKEPAPTFERSVDLVAWYGEAEELQFQGVRQKLQFVTVLIPTPPPLLFPLPPPVFVVVDTFKPFATGKVFRGQHFHGVDDLIAHRGSCALYHCWRHGFGDSSRGSKATTNMAAFTAVRIIPSDSCEISPGRGFLGRDEHGRAEQLPRVGTTPRRTWVGLVHERRSSRAHAQSSDAKQPTATRIS